MATSQHTWSEKTLRYFPSVLREALGGRMDKRSLAIQAWQQVGSTSLCYHVCMSAGMPIILTRKKNRSIYPVNFCFSLYTYFKKKLLLKVEKPKYKGNIPRMQNGKIQSEEMNKLSCNLSHSILLTEKKERFQHCLALSFGNFLVM